MIVCRGRLSEPHIEMIVFGDCPACSYDVRVPIPRHAENGDV